MQTSTAYPNNATRVWKITLENEIKSKGIESYMTRTSNMSLQRLPDLAKMNGAADKLLPDHVTTYNLVNNIHNTNCQTTLKASLLFEMVDESTL